MLIGLKRAAPNFVRETGVDYGAPCFPHDQLDVYHTSIELAKWLHILQGEGLLTKRQQKRLDITTTGILLNIAEGCGKPSAPDKQKFLETAYAHTLQTALALDLAAAQGFTEKDRLAAGKNLSARVASMLLSWIGTLTQTTDN
ncbi:MAG: four helix bundle protein [Verrucomicrobia bacterium]|nr:four helix bundle protein [Verrucomicrobiota bacterium]